jgi:ribonuclease D
MIAARILGWSKIGLGAILEQEFGVVVNKGHQRADWGQRPLPPNLIRYAQTDTHYLLTLRDRLHKELEEAGRLEEAREAFAEVCRAEWSESSFNPEHFWRINGAAQLPPRARAVLRELYIWREREAERRDLPLFKVASDQLLLRLAQEMPRSHNDLRHQIGLTETQLRRHAAGVLRSIQLGLKAPIPKAPPRRNSYNHVVQRYEALHAWRKERAAQRGVESDVIMPKDALWELAEVAPRTMEQLAALRSLGPWKRRAYGAELLAVLTELDGQVTGTTRK